MAVFSYKLKEIGSAIIFGENILQRSLTDDIKARTLYLMALCYKMIDNF